MATPWINNIQFLVDLADYVTAKDTNRPLQQIAQRTKYLFDALNTAQIGELLIARNTSVATTVVPGTPVWFDTSDATWKPAQSVVDQTSGNNFGFALPQSEVRGLVLVKHTTTTGDVALHGNIRNSTWNIDWAEVTDDASLTAGRYYLSVTSGKITRDRTLLSVEIGVLDSTGNMVFTPQRTGNLRDHLHLKFELLTTEVADLVTPGWAPAGSFSNAPIGAQFGYNIQLDAGLVSRFPPQPIDNYYLEYNGVGVHPDSVLVDANGIWWMDAVNDPAGMAAPLYQTGKPSYFNFWMTLLNFGSKIVNSLQTLDNASSLPITIQNLQGQTNDEGDLRIFLDSIMKVNATPQINGQALKSVTGVTGRFGPVVDRVVPGPGIVITGTAGDSTNGFSGELQISQGSALALELRGTPALVALDNAREDFYAGMVPVLNLPQGRISGLKFKFRVPDPLVGTYQLRLRIGVLSAGAYAAQALGLSWLIISPLAVVPGAPTAGAAQSINALANQLTYNLLDPVPGLTAGSVVLVDVLANSPAQDIMLASINYELTAV